MCGLALGYSGASMLNREIDFAAPSDFDVRVARSYETSGKGGGLFFVLDSWGPENQSRTIRPPREIHQRAAAGVKIGAHLHPGGLGVPWYEFAGTCGTSATASQ
jgi:hypothetical protein